MTEENKSKINSSWMGEDTLDYTIGKLAKVISDNPANIEYPISIENGGTGADNLEEARMNLKIPDPVEVVSHNEVDTLYEQYVDSVLNPKPRTIYAYAHWDTNVLHFTHNRIADYDDGHTDEYSIEPTSTGRPWEEFGRTGISVITSEKIIAPYSMKNFFSGLRLLENVDALASWNTSFVTDMSNMFQACLALKNLDGVANWDTSSVTNLREAFSNCTMLQNVDGLANWNLSSLDPNILCLYQTFYNCSSVSSFESLNRWNLPEAVITNISPHRSCFRSTTGTLPSWVPDDDMRGTWTT